MKSSMTTKQSMNNKQSSDQEKNDQKENNDTLYQEQELKDIIYAPVHSKVNNDISTEIFNGKEKKKKKNEINSYEITDSSNQITNDRENNNQISFKIQKIKNLNNNTLSADTYTYNESGEEITSLSNSFDVGNSASLNIQKEKADQFVTLFDELSKIQTEDFKDISNQRSLLLEKVQKLLNLIEYYESMIKQEKEKTMIIDNKNCQLQEQLTEFQNQNDFIRQEITALLIDKLNENSEDPVDDDFYSFILNSFQKVINEYEQKIANNYVEKNRYEILLQQLEQSIELLSGISSMNGESSKKTYILTQCARIGHFIDEQMNNNRIENLPNENSFCQFNPKALIETFFDKIGEDEEEENEEEDHDNILNKSPYKEIMLFFVGINKINELLTNKNQDLIKENEELKNLLSTQDLQIKDYEEWKQKQLENISLIEDTLGYQNSNSEFSINEMNAETMKYPPEEAIKNLIRVYNDALAENKILADDIRKLKKPQEMEQTFDSIKTQFISLERDFTKEKVKFDETIKELALSIQEKDKIISEDKTVISKLYEKKQKYKEEVKKSYSDINSYQTQISELENQIKMLNEENDNFKQKSANLESNIDQLENEKSQHHTQVEEIIEEMKNKEKKYKKKILKFKKQLFEFDKYQEENEKKCTKIIESNKKNIQHLKDQIENRNKEISSLKNNLNEFIVKIKEFQTNEQILNTKLNLMKKKEEAISNEKELIKKNSSEKIEFISKKIESMTNSLLSLMKNTFDYEPQTFDVSFETLISIFSDILTKNKTSFTDIKIRCDQLNNALLNMKNENQLLKKEVEKASSFKKPKITFEPNNSSELTKWEVWAKSLCNRICHYSLSNPNDLRFAIEETMMCSIGYKNVYQKLEFLRAEKKIFILLMKQGKNVTFNPQNRPIKQKQSIKSIMMIIIFCGRIRKIAGAKAIESIITNSFSVGRSLNESQTNSFNGSSILTRTTLQ